MAAREGQKNLEQHIAEIIWYRAKTESAPKLEIKKNNNNPGMEKGRCPILEFQMQNGEQLGTDPLPSLAKKKKGEITKKIPKAKPFSAKKTAEPKQGYTKHVTDTHKKYPATRFQIEKWSIKNSNSGRIAETQKEGLNRE